MEGLELPENGLGSIIQKVRIFMDHDKEHPDANVLQALDDLGIEHSPIGTFSTTTRLEILMKP